LPDHSSSVGEETDMRRKLSGTGAIILSFLLFFSSINPSSASTTSTQSVLFFDDFNDGDINGWWIGPSHKVPSDYGNWRVEDGTLIQNSPGDGFNVLLENFQFSNQIVENQIKFIGPSGYGGILIWFQDYSNLIHIMVYPGAGEIWVDEFIDGVRNTTSYPYSIDYNENL